ncbi:MAG: alpha/beta hydrolase [Propionibacteriaceae bacterium]|jgi:pimeloyl-ACP methyl ester carboxylesterase|nr:alpha/beta hydrolase [Propionibacteriaceae bacterium]
MYFQFHNHQVHFVDEGQGRPVLLLNGVYMNTRSWDPFIAEAPAACRLIRLDFFNQGDTDRLDEDYPISLQADLVIGLIEHLGLDQVDLVGTSYGGVVALAVAARRPDLVRRMVVSNTAAHFPPSFHTMILSLTTAFGALAWSGPRIFNSLTHITRSIDGVDLRQDLAQITCPTLVISSDYDALAPKHLQLAMVAGLPDSSYANVAHAGHVLVYERPREFAGLAFGFLEEPGATLPTKTVQHTHPR